MLSRSFPGPSITGTIVTSAACRTHALSLRLSLWTLIHLFIFFVSCCAIRRECVRRRRAAAPPSFFCARLPLPLLFFCFSAASFLPQLQLALRSTSYALRFLSRVALAFRFCLKGLDCLDPSLGDCVFVVSIGEIGAKKSLIVARGRERASDGFQSVALLFAAGIG